MLNFRLLFIKFPTSTPLKDCLKLRFKMKVFFTHSQISLKVNISGDSQKYWRKSQPQYAYKRYAYKKTCNATRKRIKWWNLAFRLIFVWVLHWRGLIMANWPENHKYVHFIVGINLLLIKRKPTRDFLCHFRDIALIRP